MATAQKFFPQFGADVRDIFSLPKFIENFDIENTTIINAEYKTELDQKISNFKKEL